MAELVDNLEPTAQSVADVDGVEAAFAIPTYIFDRAPRVAEILRGKLSHMRR
jgi:hypothetical protein